MVRAIFNNEVKLTLIEKMIALFSGGLVELGDMKAFVNWPLWLDGEYVSAIN
jgi:hypothetical protein